MHIQLHLGHIIIASVPSAFSSLHYVLTIFSLIVTILLTCLLSIPLEHLLPKCNFFTYMLCMAMHQLTFSSQELSLSLMDTISFFIFT